MTIIATIPHMGASLTVEVTDVFQAGGRKLAAVRALTGQPFSAWTHGGWSYSDSANVPAAILRGVALCVELPGALVLAEV